MLSPLGLSLRWKIVNFSNSAHFSEGIKILLSVKLFDLLGLTFALLNVPIVVVTVYDRCVDAEKGEMFEHLVRGAKLVAYSNNWICGVIALQVDFELKAAALTGHCGSSAVGRSRRIASSHEVLYGIPRRRSTLIKY